MTNSVLAEATPDYNNFVLPKDWHEAILQIAPEPLMPEGPEDANFIADPEPLVKYAVAQYVAGELDILELPEAVFDPNHHAAVSLVLSNIVEVKGLPEGWEDRHREMQIQLDPSLRESYDAKREEETGKKTLKVIDQELADITLARAIITAGQSRGEWSEQAVCAKAPDTSIFYIVLRRDPPPKYESTLDGLRKKHREALSYCNRCAVTEQCFEYGLEQPRDGVGHKIFGGRIIKASGQIINLLANPSKE